MSFRYEEQTKKHYQSDIVAESYNDEYTNPKGLNGLRFKFIANRERETLRRMLYRFSGSTIIDIPTGTGKMASVFRDLDCKVMACDISPNMLSIARSVFEKEKTNVIDFRILDLEVASSKIDDRFDVVVCIRLMHRVPNEIKIRMLNQISEIAPHAVVSFGIDSAYHRMRSGLRRIILGGVDAGRETRKSIQETKKLLAKDFDILERRYVASVISSEVFFLLKSKVYK